MMGGSLSRCPIPWLRVRGGGGARGGGEKGEYNAVDADDDAENGSPRGSAGRGKGLAADTSLAATKKKRASSSDHELDASLDKQAKKSVTRLMEEIDKNVRLRNTHDQMLSDLQSAIRCTKAGLEELRVRGERDDSLLARFQQLVAKRRVELATKRQIENAITMAQSHIGKYYTKAAMHTVHHTLRTIQELSHNVDAKTQDAAADVKEILENAMDANAVAQEELLDSLDPPGQDDQLADDYWNGSVALDDVERGLTNGANAVFHASSSSDRVAADPRLPPPPPLRKPVASSSSIAATARRSSEEEEEDDGRKNGPEPGDTPLVRVSKHRGGVPTLLVGT